MTNLDEKKLKRVANPDTNPCIKEAGLSLKCLEDNHYINEKCKNYFDNYNECKHFWGLIATMRKRAHIKPYLPTEKERKLILAEKEKGNIVPSVKVDSD